MSACQATDFREGKKEVYEASPDACANWYLESIFKQSFTFSSVILRDHTLSMHNFSKVYAWNYAWIRISNFGRTYIYNWKLGSLFIAVRYAGILLLVTYQLESSLFCPYDCIFNKNVLSFDLNEFDVTVNVNLLQ